MTKRTRASDTHESDGRELARALNASVPAFLLVDDLHDLPFSRAADGYLATLQSLREHLDPGVLFAWTCADDQVEAVLARFPGLADLDGAVELKPLSDVEASRLIAGRLGVRRVSDVDALHPFRPDAVAGMNEAAGGNPRRLLQLTGLVLERTVRHGAHEAGRDLVADVLLPPPARTRLPLGSAQ